MMKNNLKGLLTLSALMLVLTACGGGSKPAETTAAPAAPAETEAPFVEEEPAKNELDASNPIPGINKEYELTEQVFEDENLKLMLPEGVTAVNEGRGENMGHITVTDEEDGWKLMFRPNNFSINNVVHNVSGSVNYDGNWIKTDWSQDVAGTLAGFPIRVWANNTRKGWLHPSNENDAPGVDIVMDYGETLVGEWLGMHIRLEALDPQDDTNIYHYLYNSKLRAVLNSFETINTPDGNEITVNGITATFPARWPVKSGENSMVALLHSNELSGGITMSTQYNPDPQHHADGYEGEQFTRTYGDNDWIGVIAKHVFEKGEGEEPTVLYSMYLFSEFNEKMCADVHVSNNSWEPDGFKAFLDNEQFVDLMNSVKLDPAGWHQPGTAEVNGLLSSSGRIMSYSGSEETVEIPAMIGDYNTVFIGPNAFHNNKTIKKVVIPEGVTEIQGDAFSGCTNLEEVVLPDTLNYIYSNVFRDCPALKDVVLPESVSYVGWAAYQGSGTGTFTGSAAEYDAHCFAESGFEKISFPAGSDISGDYMFDGAQLSEIEFPEDMTALGERAFVNCHNIQKIELPETVRSIGEGAFASMFGLPYVSLPEGLTEIPDSCFNSTTLDVLVVPSTVTKIGDSATYGAACIIIQNPYVEIGNNAIQADYMYLADAKNHVFPSDHQEFWGSRLYLDGVYSPSDIQGDFYNACSISDQVYLPSDATEEESNAMDAYLASLGLPEISWIGSARDFLPEDTFGFEKKNSVIQSYGGESKKLVIPDYSLVHDGDWWITGNVYGVADEAFKDSDFTAAYFRGNCGEITGSRILAGNTQLKDIWFTTQLLYDTQKYKEDTFAGIPEDVTVHLPASFTDDQRSQMEDFLHSIGIPAGASFDYYSLRDQAPAAKPAAPAETEAGAETAEAAETAGAAETVGAAAAADGALYVNDGTTAGVYSLYKFGDMTVQEFAGMAGMPVEEAAKIIQVELTDDGKAFFVSEGESNEVKFTLDGENFTMEAEEESISGTLKDGLLEMESDGEKMTLARLTEAAFAAQETAAPADRGGADVWKGSYTKFVGDSDDAKVTDEEFSLELYTDGTGVHHRDDLDINVTWELNGEEFKMTETFMGVKLEYTGTMSGNILDLFNGDPQDDFTCEYVYEK